MAGEWREPDVSEGAEASDASDWDAAPNVEETARVEVIFAPASTATSIVFNDDAFTALLWTLRALPGPCAPPVDEGAFAILYTSAPSSVRIYPLA
jgi:hypothetical protein